ncbi:MAG: hypothetical protein LBK47_02705 [Prevotellaceae bacterium]|nr:hypothetical protein [Prevotellaceae bacterium]
MQIKYYTGSILMQDRENLQTIVIIRQRAAVQVYQALKPRMANRCKNSCPPFGSPGYAGPASQR